MPLFVGVLMVALIIWIIVTPVIVGCGPWETIPLPADSVPGVPPN
jgi:hypothetical protein